MPLRLRAISIHPVKSTAGRPVTSARVTRAGLAGDRRWMVVDTAGSLVSARECRSLLQVVADTPETDPGCPSALRLSAAGVSALSLTEPREGTVVAVQLHRHRLTATECDPQAHDWLRTATGRADLRLVWCHDPTARAVNPEYGRDGDHTAFPDGYPVTVATAESLGQLNDWVARRADELGEVSPARFEMGRFRPNLVVSAQDPGELEPFAEDGWQSLTIGQVRLRVAKGIDRCVMTTIDPVSLAGGKEPIRTLARHRQRDGLTWFGNQLIPEAVGVIRVGDEVVVAG